MPKAKTPMALTAELVALCERREPDTGSEPGLTELTEQERYALIEQLIQQAGAGPLWVFAYGSLIWNPAFTYIEHRRATAYGWHRAFCLEMKSWRGSPQAPGLMMALDRGGCCTGLVFRIPEDDLRRQVSQLVRREVDYREDLHTVRWISVRASSEKIRALTFWAGPTGKGISKRQPLDKVAWTIARACGRAGSCAAYLFQTVSKLEELGIRDRNLWRLQQLVADEITSLATSGASKRP